MKRFRASFHRDVSQSTSSPSASSSQIEAADQAEQDHPTFIKAKAALARSRAYEKLMKLVKGVGRFSVLLAKLAEPCLEGSPFKAVPAVLAVIAEAIAAVKDTKDDAEALLERFYERLSAVSDHIAKSDSLGPQSVAAEFVRELFDYADKINRIAHASYAKALDAKKLKSDLDDIVKDIDRTTGTFSVHRTTGTFSLRVLLSIERDTKGICDKLMKGNFDRWNRAPAARFKADTAQLGFARGQCTEGTRVDILNRIYRWAADTSTPPIFWLSGMAGSGKSTIAYTVCKHFSVEGTTGASLGASFFCSRQVAELRQVGNVIPTMAYQLARHSRLYAQALEKVDPDVVHVSSEQVEKLLLKPWAGFANKRPDELPLSLIVIDALDEIENEEGVRLLEDLIGVFENLGHERMRQLKIFVTSRPHPYIVNSSTQLHGDTVFRLEDIAKADVSQDILTYLNSQLPDLASSQPHLLQVLTGRSDGLFIYAATIVRVLFPSKYSKRLSPLEQQRKLLQLFHGTNVSQLSELKGVYNLYKEVLVDAIAEEHLSLRLPILHRIICALQPLSVDALSQLADVDVAATTSLVEDLHSVLYISKTDGCVYVYHKSFSDFMLDSSLAGATFACDQGDEDAALSRACFRIVRSSLHFNMCSLPSSYLLDFEVPDLPETVKTNIRNMPCLEYVCRYWPSHTMQVTKPTHIIHDILKLLTGFIDEKVLFWIEVMNLLGAQSLCYDALQKLIPWADSQANATPELRRSLRIVAQFAYSFLFTAASASTPHLYISCLATEFATNPEAISGWKARFAAVPRIQHAGLGGHSAILTHIQVGAGILCAVFSPGGARVVTGSKDYYVQLWDASTGTQIMRMYGHTRAVYSVSFSSDGLHIASGSKDRSVRIWDASTGECLQIMSGHKSTVHSVMFSFSPDGSRVVSSSDDHSVRIWDVLSGLQLHGLHGHLSAVNSVAFSPLGSHVVSGSFDQSVQIWDALTGARLQQLDGHSDTVYSVAFSLSGSYIASGSRDKSIRIWNALTGAQLQKLDGHTDHVYSVAFSPNGSRIVSGSRDHSIRIWDVATGAQLHELHGHTDWINSVAFSRDGARIVSGSDDMSVRAEWQWGRNYSLGV